MKTNEIVKNRINVIKFPCNCFHPVFVCLSFFPLQKVQNVRISHFIGLVWSINTCSLLFFFLQMFRSFSHARTHKYKIMHQNFRLSCFWSWFVSFPSSPPDFYLEIKISNIFLVIIVQNIAHSCALIYKFLEFLWIKWKKNEWKQGYGFNVNC